MKKNIIPLFVVLLLSLFSWNSYAEGTDDDSSYIRVLVDETDMVEIEKEDQDFFVEEFDFSRDTDWRYSFKNNDELWGYGTIRKKLEEFAAVDIKDSGSLNYSTLKNYDVLVIASFTESYSSKEADAIKQFVENGGSLLLLAENEFANNSVSRVFDVTFSSETVFIADETIGKDAERRFVFESRGIALVTRKMYYLTIEDLTEHPITKGLEEFYILEGLPITSHKKGTVLARTHDKTWADESGEGQREKDPGEEEGPFDVVLAIDNFGKGRAVFIGSSSSFWNLLTNKLDENVQLIANAVKWLGEPGGPYRQYKSVVEQGQQQLSSAVSLFDSHSFSQAQTAFERAIEIFEESNVIYRNDDAVRGIEEATSYIGKCETGLKADEAFEKAEDLYEEREYEDAITEYGNAQALYEEIDYTERVAECQEMTDESSQWISLREEATTKLQEAEDSLTTAPSTLDPSGYTKSKSLFEEAKSTWEEYGDPDKEAVCTEKILFCEQEIASIEKTRMMIMVAVVIIVIGVGVIIVSIVMRRKKPKAAKISGAAPREPEAEGPGEPQKSVPLDALEERYARGEITRDEYERLKSVLEKD